MNRTRAAFFPEAPLASLADCFSEGMAGAGVWKWRLVYDREGIRECTCTPYVMRRMERLRLVSDDTIDYAYKRANRSALEAWTRPLRMLPCGTGGGGARPHVHCSKA